MCSNTGRSAGTPGTPDEVAARFAAAIDACATAAASHDDDAGARLAAVWALLAGSDPDLAARMARYETHHE